MFGTNKSDPEKGMNLEIKPAKPFVKPAILVTAVTTVEQTLGQHQQDNANTYLG